MTKSTTNKKKKNKVGSGSEKKNYRMISVHFQHKPYNITVIPVYDPTNNAKEAEIE